MPSSGLGAHDLCLNVSGACFNFGDVQSVEGFEWISIFNLSRSFQGLGVFCWFSMLASMVPDLRIFRGSRYRVDRNATACGSDVAPTQ